MDTRLIGTYIEFEREALDDGELAGFVLAVSEELTLIHRVDGDFSLEGYSVFRNRDVSSWTTFDSPDYFKNRAFRLNGVHPRRPRGLDISCWHRAFESAGMRFPLLVLHREALSSDVCYVGALVARTPKTVTLFEISSTAEWEKATRFCFADVTRLDFGGGYEDALWRVAAEDGPPPAKAEHVRTPSRTP